MGVHFDPAASLGETPVERCERRRVSLRAYAMRDDGSGPEVLVLDLSYEGCGIQTPVELKAGEAIKLSVLQRGAIAARVRWCKGGKAGLVFDSVMAKSKPFWPRRSERTSLTAEISMRRLGKLNYRVQVFDISCDGCKVELVDKPRLHEHVLVKFDGLEILDAQVCWVEGSCAGLRFEKSIHPAVFGLLLARLS